MKFVILTLLISLTGCAIQGTNAYRQACKRDSGLYYVWSGSEKIIYQTTANSLLRFTVPEFKDCLATLKATGMMNKWEVEQNLIAVDEDSLFKAGLNQGE